MKVDVQLVGFDELIKNIENGSREAKNLYLRALDKTAKEVQSVIREESPYLSGKLRRSVDTEINQSELSAKIWPAEPYAPFVEFGTSPHPINSPVKIKGNWYYIGMHPGTKANDFVGRAFKQAGPIAQHNFGVAIDNLLKIITK